MPEMESEEYKTAEYRSVRLLLSQELPAEEESSVWDIRGLSAVLGLT